ncbi:hypothetical protein [Streptomyces sp. CL12-4]|uniref:hypothetical protein n=1 Tax=Streptomyces sp. CL12-4 TaxID=2810306 RepID=UPI001EFB58B5|nr:hypothetical protein [Streptomyces sp. CL12-4]
MRRGRLETLFAEEVLAAPFVLCPATTDRAMAEDWLDPAWGAAGIEGVVVKGLAQKYQPARRGWMVTGCVAAPSTLLLGRYDEAGRLRFVARTAPLSATAREEVGGLLYPGGAEHPWQHRRFSAGWAHARRSITARSDPTSWSSSPGTPRWTRAATAPPVRYLRVRDDISPAQLPPQGT